MTKIALITGGTRGIGAAISKRLATTNNTVIATYTNDDDAAKVFAQETGIATYRWDISNFEECSDNVKSIEDKFGSIDILVNNAGITRDSMMHKMPLKSWQKVMAVNLDGCFNMCRVVIEGMRGRGWGRIVNISSVNAQAGCMGQTNYSASKAGIIGLTKSLALESAGKGITVNAVTPGYISTDMTEAMPESAKARLLDRVPLKRMGGVDDIAHAVAFLIGDDAAYITGSTISINGGYYMD